MASNNPSNYAAAVRQGSGDGIAHWISRTFSRSTGHESLSDEDEESDEPISKAEDWRLMPEIRQAKLNDHASGRRLGVTWSDLTVKGVSSEVIVNENALSQYNIPQKIKESMHSPPLKTIVDSSFGCVKPGEMLLVLGRPGSGCTSLLKMLANRRKGYAAELAVPLKKVLSSLL